MADAALVHSNAAMTTNGSSCTSLGDEEQNPRHVACFVAAKPSQFQSTGMLLMQALERHSRSLRLRKAPIVATDDNDVGRDGCVILQHVDLFLGLRRQEKPRQHLKVFQDPYEGDNLPCFYDASAYSRPSQTLRRPLGTIHSVLTRVQCCRQ